MRFICLVASIGILAGCQAADQERHDPGSVAGDSLIRDGADASGGGTVVYSWVDENGRIRMASRPEDVPPAHRARVVVTDTGRGRKERLLAGKVMLVDLREGAESGPGNYTVVDLDKLARPETPETASDDPGVLGRRAVGALARAARELLGLPVEPDRRAGQVILYTAPWCGFCKKAALHLKERGTAFVERDIESDRLAAVELSRKLREAGLRQGGVPVLDIGGTIVIGFNKDRIDKLLDEL